jgi:hypothetical protein
LAKKINHIGIRVAGNHRHHLSRLKFLLSSIFTHGHSLFAADVSLIPSPMMGEDGIEKKKP